MVIPLGQSGTVPATGGALSFLDVDDQPYDLIVPAQKKPVSLTFKSSRPKPIHELPNPTKIKAYRIVIKLDASDDKGNPVHRFDPPLRATVKYLPSDVERVKADYPNDEPLQHLIRIYHNGSSWNRLSRGKLDTMEMTLEGLIATFSGDGIGGD